MQKTKKFFIAVCAFLITFVSIMYIIYTDPYIRYASEMSPTDIISASLIVKCVSFLASILLEVLICISKNKTKKQKIILSLIVWSIFLIIALFLQNLTIMSRESLSTSLSIKIIKWFFFSIIILLEYLIGFSESKTKKQKIILSLIIWIIFIISALFVQNSIIKSRMILIC